MTDHSSIADQIKALEVKVPLASHHQPAPSAAPTERKKPMRPGAWHHERRERAAARGLKAIEFVFQKIVEAALAGERCPTSDDFLNRWGVHNSTRYFSDLADEGRIRTEVSARNWRTVWICEGEHRGKHTTLPARKSRPYMVLGPERPA